MTGRHRIALRVRRAQPRTETTRLVGASSDAGGWAGASAPSKPGAPKGEGRGLPSQALQSSLNRHSATSVGGTVILATVTPGLEATCANEIVTRVPEATEVATGRGKVWVSVPDIDRRLATVRTADNLFLHLGEVESGPIRRDLPDLAEAVASLPALEPILGGRPDVRGSGFVVNVSRRGKQTWSRFEAGSMIADAISARFPNWPDLTGIIAGGQGAGGRGIRVAVELRVDVEDDCAIVSWRLTPPTFRFRGPDRGFARAALLPTVAHALVLISDPRPHDRFLDPFAGSGTITTERRSLVASSVTGLEIDPHVAIVARSNSAAGSHLVVGDARAMPLDSGSIDAIVTNLPFGRQILDDDAIPNLYAAAAREFARVLVAGPDGRVVTLTTRVPEVLNAMTAAGFTSEMVSTLGLNGQRPTVVKFVRR